MTLLLSILSINLNNISYNKTNIFPLNKKLSFVVFKLLIILETSKILYIIQIMLIMPLLNILLQIKLIQHVDSIKVASIALQIYEQFGKFTSQYFDSNDYIEKYPY